MQILLKELLKEVDEPNPLQVQIYIDMDGVLVDMDGGFKKISGGYEVDNFKNAPEFGGDQKKAQKRFWRLIQSTPNFWLNLEPMPDAKVLWKFVKDNFKDPVPVILSAGQGTSLIQQKTQWIRKHIDPQVKVIVASGGAKKPEYIIDQPGKRITHVLIDDTQKNIDAWNNTEKHRIAILHSDAGNSIKQLQQFLNEH